VEPVPPLLSGAQDLLTRTPSPKKGHLVAEARTRAPSRFPTFPEAKPNPVLEQDKLEKLSPTAPHAL